MGRMTIRPEWYSMKCLWKLTHEGLSRHTHLGSNILIPKKAILVKIESLPLEVLFMPIHQIHSMKAWPETFTVLLAFKNVPLFYKQFSFYGCYFLEIWRSYRVCTYRNVVETRDGIEMYFFVINIIRWRCNLAIHNCKCLCTLSQNSMKQFSMMYSHCI